MSAPVRIQRQRTAGWKMPEGAVYVGRPGIFGNPFPVDCYGAEGATDRFRRWITGHMSWLESSQSSRCDRWSGPDGVTLTSLRRWMLDDMSKLRGKDLACWCAPGLPCHADVLLELANPKPSVPGQPE